MERGKCVCVVKIARGAFHDLTHKLSTPVNQPVTARNFNTDLFALCASVRISACLRPEVPSSVLSQHLPPGLLSEQHHFTLGFHTHRRLSSRPDRSPSTAPASSLVKVSPFEVGCEMCRLFGRRIPFCGWSFSWGTAPVASGEFKTFSTRPSNSRPLNEGAMWNGPLSMLFKLYLIKQVSIKVNGLWIWNCPVIVNKSFGTH